MFVRGCVRAEVARSRECCRQTRWFSLCGRRGSLRGALPLIQPSRTQAARFKAEIHFNPKLLSDKYLSAHDNLAEVYKTCASVKVRCLCRWPAPLSLSIFLRPVAILCPALPFPAGLPEFSMRPRSVHKAVEGWAARG